MKGKLDLYSVLWVSALIAVVAISFLFSCNLSYQIPNILNIEFSSSSEIFNEHIENLISSDKISVLRNNTTLDFLFILCYTLLFLFSAKVFELSLQTKFRYYLYLLCLLPGIADLIENFMLLEMLSTGATLNKFETFYWAVRFKWTMVIVFILMTLAILLYYCLVFIGKGLNLIESIFRKPINK